MKRPSEAETPRPDYVPIACEWRQEHSNWHVGSVTVEVDDDQVSLSLSSMEGGEEEMDGGEESDEEVSDDDVN